MVKINHPVLRTVIAILLGLLVLILSGVLMQIISVETGLFKKLPFIGKTFTHSSMLVFSVMLILILNKGNIRGYGFTWNINFPLGKIILISLLLGFTASLIIELADVSMEEYTPTKDFSFIEIIVYIWFWASICEEVLTRGLIQGFLSPVKHIGVKILRRFISLPVIAGALFFGAMHLMLLTLGTDIFVVLIIVIFAVILGFIAGYFKEQTNSLVPAILVHFCFNVGGSFLQIFSFI